MVGGDGPIRAGLGWTQLGWVGVTGGQTPTQPNLRCATDPNLRCATVTG